jgi:hypothetical protein
MHRLMVCATLACAVAVAACSSSTSPKSNPNKFSGLWFGTWGNSPSTLVSHLTVTQTGDSIVGVDSEYNSGTFSTAYPIAGNATTTSINFTYTGYGPYKGAFITADSVAGYYYYDGTDSTTLVWKKQ